MQITRRELLQLAGAAALADERGDQVSQRAATFISAYSAEGFHRLAETDDHSQVTLDHSGIRGLVASRRRDASPEWRYDCG